MIEGNKPLEIFVIITVFANRDVIEYVISTVNWSLCPSHTLFPFSHNPVPPFLKAHVISTCNFPFLCVRWWG